jgi:hypothetical protein
LFPYKTLKEISIISRIIRHTVKVLRLYGIAYRQNSIRMIIYREAKGNRQKKKSGSYKALSM